MPEPSDLVPNADPASEDSSDDSDEEAARDADELPAEVLAVRAQLAPAVEQVIIEVQDFEDAVQVDEAQAPVAPVENNMEVHPPDRGSPADVTLDAIREIVREELARRRPPGPETFLNNISYRYFVAATGLIAAIMSSRAFYAALKSAFDPSSALSARVEAANDDSAAAIRAAWLMDETTFWGLLSGYVSRCGPRPYPEQLQFMQFTEDLSRFTMTTKWTWDAAADKLGLVTQLTDTLTQAGAAAAYAQVPTLKYKGQSLPRAVIANIMGLALASWASKQPGRVA